MLLRLFETLSLGFFCGLIPGPIVTAVFVETIRKGWLSARRIVWIAAAGETVMSITCVLAASILNPKHPLFSALSFFGAILLFSLAWDLWKTIQINEEDPLFSRRRIFFISLFNGMAWIFWITVCTPQAMALDVALPFGRWIFIVLFEIGWLSSTLLLANFTERFRAYFQANKKLHLLYRTVAIFFLFFGTKLVIESAKRLVN